jgi:hypothetical protein
MNPIHTLSPYRDMFTIFFPYFHKIRFFSGHSAFQKLNQSSLYLEMVRTAQSINRVTAGWMAEVRFLAGAYRILAHPASYTMGSRRFFPGGKAAGV